MIMEKKNCADDETLERIERISGDFFLREIITEYVTAWESDVVLRIVFLAWIEVIPRAWF